MAKRIITEFWALPKLIAKNKELTWEDKAIIMYLFTLQNGENKVQPRQKIISEALGIPLPTIKKRISVLVKSNWIIKKGQWTLDSNRINQYIIETKV